jgi:hypothetical protein
VTTLHSAVHRRHGVLARLAALWPVYLLAGLIVASDQLMLVHVGPRWLGWSTDPYVFPPYRAFHDGYDASRPQLIVIGSSRAEEAAPAEALRREIAARGLPHQAWNLAIGGGGSPLALWLALEELTLLTRALPAGSRIVYLFSPFELNFLPLRSIAAIPAGGALLYDQGYVHLVYRLRQRSGWARFIADEWAEHVTPRLLFLLNRGAATTQSLTSDRIRCNHAGLENYRMLDLNAWAFERLADTFRDRLVIGYPPVGDKQMADDRAHRVFELSAPFVERVARDYGTRYMPDLVPRAALPAGEFGRDCDHVTSPEGARAVARLVVGTLAR